MNDQLQKQLIRAQLRILEELNTRVEEGEDFLSAWIDLRTELLERLKKLDEKGGSHEPQAARR